MMADRKDHVDSLISPNLDKGVWVISDRYLDSTIAYQGGGRQLDIDLITSLSASLKLPTPDFTLLFDLPVDVALERAKERSELDRFEREPKDFHSRIRKSYLELASTNHRIKTIDSSKDFESVSLQVENYLTEFLNALPSQFGSFQRQSGEFIQNGNHDLAVRWLTGAGVLTNGGKRKGEYKVEIENFNKQFAADFKETMSMYGITPEYAERKYAETIKDAKDAFIKEAEAEAEEAEAEVAAEEALENVETTEAALVEATEEADELTATRASVAEWLENNGLSK